MSNIVYFLIFFAILTILVLQIRRKFISKISKVSPVIGTNLKIKKMTTVEVRKILVNRPAANDGSFAAESFAYDPAAFKEAESATGNSAGWTKI